MKGMLEATKSPFNETRELRREEKLFQTAHSVRILKSCVLAKKICGVMVDDSPEDLLHLISSDRVVPDAKIEEEEEETCNKWIFLTCDGPGKKHYSSAPLTEQFYQGTETVTVALLCFCKRYLEELEAFKNYLK